MIILGYAIWQRLFGGDPGIIGRVLDLNNRPIRVIGVLPAEFHPFRMSNPGEVPQVFRPFPLAILESSNYQSGVTAVARLKRGATLGASRSDLNQIARDLAREQGNSRTQNAAVQVEPLYDRMTGKIRIALLVLFGAVGFVLLIACTNVASLLLVRVSGRTPEIAVRVALGSGRWRLARQLLTESLLLALVGGAAGVLLAKPAVGALVAAAATEIPRVDEIHIDVTVLLVALGATLASGVVFGVAPSFRLWRLDLNEMLHGYRDLVGGRGARRMRTPLVIVEIACAFLLAFGASLLGRSLDELLNVNPGYDSHHIFTMTAFAHDQDTEEKTLAYYRQLLELVRALPGVESAGMVSTPPLAAPVETTVYGEGRDRLRLVQSIWRFPRPTISG